MKLKRHLWLLVLLLVPVFGLLPFREKTIQTPYQYPVQPGTEEWAAFESRVEMAEACQIPQDVLERLSTDALLQTVLDYPLLPEMLMFYRTPEECAAEVGFWHIADSFNGLQELMGRRDALSCLEQYGTFNNLQWNGNVLTIMYRNILHAQSE